MKTVTKKSLEAMTLTLYGGGKEVKVGDKIIFALTNDHASMNGTPRFNYQDIPTQSLVAFVLPKGEKIMYQLYKISK